MNIVIFSYNRACQLEALLRSLETHYLDFDSAYVSVLYKADNGFSQGYELLKQLHPAVNFVEERPEFFYMQTFSLVKKTHDKTMFLVDDIVFRRPFANEDSTIKAIELEDFIAASLRLDRDISFCYAANKSQNVPLTHPFNEWNWVADGQYDWGYPMSLDGNVFKTKFIRQVLNDIGAYNNPNQLEAKLDGHIKRSPTIIQTKPLMSCYSDGARLLNVPANKVQNQFNNRFEDSISVEELERKFVNGERIDISGFSSIQNNSCHYPLTYTFEKRPEE